MESSLPRPDTINKLKSRRCSLRHAGGHGTRSFFAVERRSDALPADRVSDWRSKSDRLRLLLWALVAAGLLTEQDGRFANTPEANQYLVKGLPSYLGYLHGTLANAWSLRLKTAVSLRTGAPQAKMDFAKSPPETIWNRFCAESIPIASAATRSLLARHDFSSIKTLADVGCGGGGFAMTVAQYCPNLQVTAIDLPEITPITQRIVNEENAAARVNVMAADVSRWSTAGFVRYRGFASAAPGVVRARCAPGNQKYCRGSKPRWPNVYHRPDSRRFANFTIGVGGV